ncbi:MAG: DUF169 domain-containing protein [Syntrophales bacterium]|nr:DUF169 domain-containing protein [Syntrophales bacterium]
MADLTALSTELENALRLRTRIIAYKRLEKAEELEHIPGLRRVPHNLVFCQVPDMVRVHGWTVGLVNDGKMGDRCMSFCGLADATDEQIYQSAAVLTTTWFGSPEESLQQQKDCYRIPAAEAIVLAPLSEGKFDPDVILIYANAAQIMMIMCGLLKQKYERIWSSFVSEGNCGNSLAQCYVTGKPALSMASYGERCFGQIMDDEVILALPPHDLERAVSGLKKLSAKGLKYPIRFIGAEHSPARETGEFYPVEAVEEAIRTHVPRIRELDKSK